MDENNCCGKNKNELNKSVPNENKPDENKNKDNGKKMTSTTSHSIGRD